VSGSPRAGWGASIVAVLRRPSLWGVAVRQVLGLAAPGWWRRWPLLPLPAPGYLAFRMQTAYGDPAAAPARGRRELPPLVPGLARRGAPHLPRVALGPPG
jgi:hypothetical protein